MHRKYVKREKHSLHARIQILIENLFGFFFLIIIDIHTYIHVPIDTDFAYHPQQRHHAHSLLLQIVNPYPPYPTVMLPLIHSWTLVLEVIVTMKSKYVYF